MKRTNFLRYAFWIAIMACVGSFLFAGRAVYSFADTSATGAIIGAILGLFFAMLFTQRARRKHVLGK